MVDKEEKKKGFVIDRKLVFLVATGLILMLGLLLLIYSYANRNMFLTPLGALVMVVGGFGFYYQLKHAEHSFGETPLSTSAVNKAGLIRCLNIYPRFMGGIKIEMMEPGKICQSATYWRNRKDGRTYLLQVWNGEAEEGAEVKFKAFVLPDEIRYPPERLARIIGCEPLQRLKSLQFGMLERLAPFAPVVALGIGFLMFIIASGD